MVTSREAVVLRVSKNDVFTKFPSEVRKELKRQLGTATEHIKKLSENTEKTVNQKSVDKEKMKLISLRNNIQNYPLSTRNALNEMYK